MSSSSLRFRKVAYSSRQQLQLGLIRTHWDIAVRLRRELRQRREPLGSARLLGRGECATRGLDSPAVEPIRALELIEVSPCQGKARRPRELLLILRVVGIEAHGLSGVDFVLRDEAARQQLENVEAARDLRADDEAVVPIRRPGAAANQPVRVDRTAIEERDLL